MIDRGPVRLLLAAAPFAAAVSAAFAGEAQTAVPARQLERIRVSDDGTHFVGGESSRRIVLWGVNYDHDFPGRLLEDYWHDEWPTVVGDFKEIRELGANVVRVHLQLGCSSTAVFCYDLMNEPILPGAGKVETEWLAGEFGGKYFVQRIALDLYGRTRKQVAREWVRKLSSAIREVGWISFYWGKTAEEYEQSGDFRGAVVSQWLRAFREHAPERKATKRD